MRQLPCITETRDNIMSLVPLSELFGLHIRFVSIVNAANPVAYDNLYLLDSALFSIYRV